MTNNIRFIGLLRSWVIIAIGVGVASHIVEGISYDTGWTLVIAVFLLSLFNALLKPLLVLFTLPFIILTMGLGLWLINALMFVFVAKLVNGFEVASFWSALWGALIVSVIAMIANALLGRRRGPPSGGAGTHEKIDKDDAIDI